MSRQCTSAAVGPAKMAASADMDEVWEASSASGSEDEGSQQSDDDEPKAPKASPPSTASIVAPSTAVAWSTGYRAPREPQVFAQPALQRPQAPPAALQSQSMMTLITHLRKDNLRLRELLVEAQKEAEKAIESATQQAAQRGEEKPCVDFGHLLELVKEFGDDFYSDSGDSLLAPHGEAQVFAMDADGEDDCEPALPPARTGNIEDAAELQASLAARDAELASRDAEIATLRAELVIAKRRCSSAESQAPTDAGDDAASDSSANASSKSDNGSPGCGRWV